MKQSNLSPLAGVLFLFAAVLISEKSQAQSIAYSTTVNAASGQTYSVDISIELTGIVPSQSTCNNGYNYNVAYNYDIQFNGNAPSNLWTLQGTIECGTNQGIFFNLPTSPGSGTGTTTGNPWRNVSDCATATVQSLECNSIDIQIQGPGISNQTVTVTPDVSGDGTEWNTNGNTCDTNAFIGTINQTDLRFRTNNLEHMRLTNEGRFGIGVSNPLEKFELDGNMKLSGNVIFSDYADAIDTTDKVLFVDKNGTTQTKSLTSITQNIYSVDCFIGKEDNGFGGSTLITLPSWASSIANNRQVLYTGLNCPTWVGIGTNDPVTRLDVRGDIRADKGIGLGDVATPQAGFHLQNYFGSGNNPYFDYLIIVQDENGEKVLQLNNDGLLRAREIKVDEDVWPDYVFDPSYKLMPIYDLKIYIEKNGHLPNVPSAKEVEIDGVNLGETARITMEKVEELTLYTIDQQEQLDDQKAAIDALEKMLEEQRKLIETQQKLLEEQQNQLKKLK